MSNQRGSSDISSRPQYRVRLDEGPLRLDQVRTGGEHFSQIRHCTIAGCNNFGKSSFTCLHCNHRDSRHVCWMDTHTILRFQHLANCTSAPLAIQQRAQDAYGLEMQRRSDQSRYYSLSSSFTSNAASPSREPDQIQSNESMMSPPLIGKSDFHLLFAETVYKTNIPFATMDSAEWRTFFRDYTSSPYGLPTRRALSGTLLSQVYEKIKMECSEGKLLKEDKLLTLVTDGWTDIHNRSIINYLLVSREGKVYFIDATYTASEPHTAINIANGLIDIIEKVGAHKINALCTDNASNMLAAVRIVKERFPHLYSVGCHVHQFNLLIKDLLEHEKLNEVIENIKFVIKWWKNRSQAYACLRHFREVNGLPDKSLALPVCTRWQSNMMCINSLLEMESAITQTTRYSEKVRHLIEKDANRPGEIESAGEKMRSLVLDADFWKKVRFMQKVVQPITNILTSFEKDKTGLSHVLRGFGAVIQLVDSIQQDDLLKNELKAILVKRWGKIVSIPLLLAYLLDIHNHNTIPLLAPRTNHQIRDWLNTRYGEEKGFNLFNHFSNFITQSDIYNDDLAWRYRKGVESFVWWQLNYDNEFSRFAQEILSISATSCAAERAWSAYSRIHNKGRAALDLDRCRMLVFIKINGAQPKWNDTDEGGQRNDFDSYPEIQSPFTSRSNLITSGSFDSRYAVADPEAAASSELEENEDEDDFVDPEEIVVPLTDEDIDVDQDQRVDFDAAIASELKIE